MEHKLPDLPYAKDALEPHISRETLEFHYGKHHQTYVNTLNSLVPDSEFKDAKLEEIVRNASGKMFNQAAQVWNHTFYWNCLSPEGGGEPQGDVAGAIRDAFGSVDKFRDEFTQQATALFGSGWAWLVQKPDGKLAIEQTQNAGTPATGKDLPLLTCDVWEHAYYIDYRNARPKYLEAFWKLVNWEFVSANYGTEPARVIAGMGAY